MGLFDFILLILCCYKCGLIKGVIAYFFLTLAIKFLCALLTP